MITLEEDVREVEGRMRTLLGEISEASRRRSEERESGTAREARRGPSGGQGSKTPPCVDLNKLCPAPLSHIAWLWA